MRRADRPASGPAGRVAQVLTLSALQSVTLRYAGWLAVVFAAGSVCGGIVRHWDIAMAHAGERGKQPPHWMLEAGPCQRPGVASVNVVEFADGLWVATAQAGLGGSCRVSLVGAGLSISAMASTPM